MKRKALLLLSSIWFFFGVPMWLYGSDAIGALWSHQSVDSVAGDFFARNMGLYQTQLGVVAVTLSVYGDGRAIHLLLWASAAQCAMALFHWWYWIIPHPLIMGGFQGDWSTWILISWALPLCCCLLLLRLPIKK